MNYDVHVVVGLFVFFLIVRIGILVKRKNMFQLL